MSIDTGIEPQSRPLKSRPVYSLAYLKRLADELVAKGQIKPVDWEKMKP